jgi:hypothetical protein
MRRAAASSLARRGGEKGVNGRDFESGKRQRSAYPAAARRNVCDARAEAAAASGRSRFPELGQELGHKTLFPQRVMPKFPQGVSSHCRSGAYEAAW